MKACPFCEAEVTSRTIEAKERMFGFAGTFLYAQCGTCGSLFMPEPPADLHEFYPRDYYSYSHARSRLSAIGENIAARARAREYVRFLEQSGMRVGPLTTFIDVGSGSGDLLRALRAIGLPNGSGIDPYLRHDAHTGGIAVLRRPIEELALDERPIQADVVMFNHSLEHVSDPSASLRAAVKLLARDGLILVRVPIVSYAWERYGECWVGLDAPRHLSLPTEDGFARLARRVGLRIVYSRYDSTAVQFLASDAYECGLTLHGAFPSNPAKTVLRKILSLPKAVRASRLNRERRGDQAAFALAAAENGPV